MDQVMVTVIAVGAVLISMGVKKKRTIQNNFHTFYHKKKNEFLLSSGRISFFKNLFLKLKYTPL